MNTAEYRRNRLNYGTPGERLEEWLNDRGTMNARIISSNSPDLGMEVDAHDLGNGYHVCLDTEDSGDPIYGWSNSGEIEYANIPAGFSNLSVCFTGQYGSPNCMHNSEYVGGRLASLIAKTPGLWRFPVVMWDCDDDCEECDETDCEPVIEGWLVLAKPE